MSNPQTTPLSTNSIEQTDITDKLSRQAPNATHYVVFDACRNELQLTKKERKALGQEKGFVPIAQTTGLLIAYATAPQQTASDAGGDSGPYAKEIVKPGVEAVTMFRNVQLRVKDAIGQDPWLTFPTLSAVYLAGQRATTTTDAPTLNLEDTQDAGELAAFISQMPDGPYRKLLQERLADLRIKTRPTCAGGRTWPPTNISVGAVQISSARAPWAAGLKLGGAGQCSATIVAANWAIAAGHCVTETKTQVVSGKTKIVGWEPRTPSDLKLIVGADDLDSASPAETYEVEQIIVHEKFSGDGSGGNNIALLKLSRPWPGDPARLSSQIDVDPPGVTFEHPNARMLGVVTGYGISASIGKPNRLREVVLPFVEQTKCRSSYPGRVGDGEICAGFERGGADACQGFSGGPLAALTDDGCPFVVGIVAWGEGCGEPGYYGVYTRLSYYKSWLQSHVPELKFVDRDEVARGSPPAQLSEAWRAVLGAIK